MLARVLRRESPCYCTTGRRGSPLGNLSVKQKKEGQEGCSSPSNHFPPAPRMPPSHHVAPHHGIDLHFLSVYFFSVYTRSTPWARKAFGFPIFGGGNAILPHTDEQWTVKSALLCPFLARACNIAARPAIFFSAAQELERPREPPARRSVRCPGGEKNRARPPGRRMCAAGWVTAIPFPTATYLVG